MELKKYIKPLIVIQLCLIGSLMVTARDSYSKGEKSFGPKLGFVTRNTSASAGLVFNYSFSRHLRISPDATLIFRHKNLDAITFDLDMHFPMPFSHDKMAIYHLVGLNISSWSKHDETGGLENKDVTTHLNRIGANVGVGYEFKCNPTLRINFEAKYTIIQTFPGAEICAGISYVF